MIIQNLHQPYLFKNTDKINLIVSEFMNKNYTLTFGGNTILEDCWKLHHLDENYKKTLIQTPEFILYKNNYYKVIAECNGYVDKNNLSYVAAVHDGQENSPLQFLLIIAEYDIINHKTYNHNIITKTRTGFIKNNNIFSIDKTFNKITKNDVFIFDYTNYLDEFIRLIGKYNEDVILFTGIKNNDWKTYSFNLNDNTLSILKNKNNSESIYKSSIIENENDGLIAYTDKVFREKFVNDYFLYIENEYNLIKV